MPRTKSAATKPGYSFADVLALTDATKSNLLHWTHTGTITAALQESAGRGHRRRYSPFNVIEVQLAVEVNKFGVSVKTISHALHMFRQFHRQAVALHEQRTKAPLVTEPKHLVLFKSLDQRRAVALNYFRYLPYAKFRGVESLSDDEQAEIVKTKARAIGNVWEYLRIGPMVHGKGDPSWSHFLGLFISRPNNELNPPVFDVVLDPNPTELMYAIEGSAIVIDLADVIFRVGEHCKRLGGFELGRW